MALETFSRINYKCPICKDIFSKPIYTCLMGHNICGICVSSNTRCTICTKRITTRRNFALEKSISEKNMSLNPLAARTIPKADFNNKCRCPVKSCPLFVPQDAQKLRDHLKGEHNIEVLKVLHSFIINKTNMVQKSESSVEQFYKMLLYDGEILKLHAKLNYNQGNIYFAIQICSSKQAPRFLKYHVDYVKPIRQNKYWANVNRYSENPFSLPFVKVYMKDFIKNGSLKLYGRFTNT